MKFRVDLDMFRGPMDLLLYLVRKHEMDITDVPIALITGQYLDYLAIIEKIDVNAVGDFLQMASTLIEIKSRLVLPRADEVHEPLEDPREQLVQRLLEYRKYKDAATILEDRSRQWQRHLPRLADDLPPRRIDPADQPIHEVELWDLVSALGRIIRDEEATRPSNIVYDETPIQTYMRDIVERLVEHGRVAFTEMFRSGMHKSAMIGVFLAVLELVRHHRVCAEQDHLHGEIWLLPTGDISSEFVLDDVDNYDRRGDDLAATGGRSEE